MEDSAFHLSVTDEIDLTELRASDVASIVKHIDDPDIYKVTLRIPHPYGEDDAQKYLEYSAKMAESHGHPVQLAVRLASGELVGVCGFEGLVYGHRAEIGYWLSREYWRRGIMGRVVQTACRYAFDHWRLQRVTAQVFEFNAASAALLEKCGFKQEGLLRQHTQKGKDFIDVRYFGLLREELLDF